MPSKLETLLDKASAIYLPPLFAPINQGATELYRLIFWFDNALHKSGLLHMDEIAEQAKSYPL